MNGYIDDWYNGVWCYADVRTCKDASKHPEDSKGLQGYGASKIACQPGDIFGELYFHVNFI